MYKLGLGCKATCASLWGQYGLVALVQAGTAAWQQREGGCGPCLHLAPCGPTGAWSQGWSCSSSDCSGWKKDHYWQTRIPWSITATRWL